MPCYSRVSSTVEFGEGTDAGLLQAAMKSLGYIVGKAGSALRFSHPDTGAFGNYQDGRLTISTIEGTPLDQNQFKRAYSAEVVKAAAKRFGWQAKQTNETTFQVTRRI